MVSPAAVMILTVTKDPGINALMALPSACLSGGISIEHSSVVPAISELQAVNIEKKIKQKNPERLKTLSAMQILIFPPVAYVLPEI